jgi:prevent-host-death family protein
VSWKIGEAKQQLSKVVRLAQKEPQILSNRDEPVAAIVSMEELERFREWQARSGKTLDEAFEELRKTAEEEEWELVGPARASRDNPMLEVLAPERRSKTTNRARRGS